MNLASLFVSIGVRGSSKSVGAIGQVKKGLKETKEVGFAAKAAIIGAVYALERLFSASGKFGNDMMNFSATTGVAARTLQQYQHAARQVGVANEEVEGSFRGLQGAITNTLIGKGAPEGLAEVSRVVSQIGIQLDKYSLAGFAQAPDQLLQVLQKYAQLEGHAGLRNQVLKSFGLGEGMIAALTRNAFKPDVLAKAPVLGDKTLAANERAMVGWSNLKTKTEHLIAQFNAKHGESLVNDISKLVTEIYKLADAFTVLADKVGLFDVFGDVLKGWTAIFKGELSSAVESSAKELYGSDSLINKLKVVGDFLTGNTPGEKAASVQESRSQHQEMMRRAEEIRKARESGVPVAPLENPAPKTDRKKTSYLNPEMTRPNSVPAGLAPAFASNNNVIINQNLNFSHEGKNAKQVADNTQKAISNAFRQIPTLAQMS
jgi:hypothetical protein